MSVQHLDDGLGREFWEHLDRLEGRRRRLQGEQEAARRGLEVTTRHEIEELNRAWQRYCEVIAELDETAAEFEALRTRAV